jgi:hypothetical protein
MYTLCLLKDTVSFTTGFFLYSLILKGIVYNSRHTLCRRSIELLYLESMFHCVFSFSYVDQIIKFSRKWFKLCGLIGFLK